MTPSLSRCVAVVFLLCQWLGCQELASHAQASGAVEDAVYPVHGSVLDGVSGKQIPHVLVTSPDHRLATMTDSDGHFALTIRVPRTVQPGSSATVSSGPRPLFDAPLMLQAQKPGYLDLDQPISLPLDETLPTQTLVIKLMPSGSIVGRVTADDDAAAPRGVNVVLLRHEVQDGFPQWKVSSQRATDSLGEFHFTHLRPGTYTVVSAEWRGRQPQPSWSPTTVTREYPPVFLGDVSSFGAATRLHLHPGETAPTELHLHPAPYYPVTVPVAIVAGSTPFIQVHVVEASQKDTYDTLGLGYNARDSAVEGWLPEGNYTLRLGNYGDSTFTLASVHVAGKPVRVNPVALAPAGTVQVRVHAELQHAAGAPVPNLQVNLRGLGTGGGWTSGHLHPGTASEFSIQNVQPGQYMATAYAGEGYVAGMRSGSVDLLHAPLTTNADGTADPIDITLRDDSGTITGKVIAHGPSFAPVFGVLIPTGDTGVFMHFSMGVNEDFNVSGVAAGVYRLIAITTQPETLPYRDSEAIGAYAKHGTLVTVTPGQQVTADVPLLSAAEVDAAGEGP